MVVSDLRDAHGEAPVFESGDDLEGFAYKLGNDCTQWLGFELDDAITRISEPE